MGSEVFGSIAHPAMVPAPSLPDAPSETRMDRRARRTDEGVLLDFAGQILVRLGHFTEQRDLREVCAQLVNSEPSYI